MKFLLSFIVFLHSFAPASAQKKFIPADATSYVSFTIKNFGVTVDGELSGLKGSIIINEKKLSSSSIDVTVDVNTIDTKNDRRDKHLCNEDYFEAEKYPTMRIKSTSILSTNTVGTYLLKAYLTVKDVTKPINLFITIVANSEGYLLSGNFEIDRIAYHVGKSSITMGDRVKIDLKVQAQ